MKFLELVKECHQGAGLQRLTKCKSFIGSEIEMTYCINNISKGMIFLGLHDDEPYYGHGNTFEEKYSFKLYLTFDENKFGNQLLKYSVGDIVTIKANFKSVDMSDRLLVTLDMTSIRK